MTKFRKFPIGCKCEGYPSKTDIVYEFIPMKFPFECANSVCFRSMSTIKPTRHRHQHRSTHNIMYQEKKNLRSFLVFQRVLHEDCLEMFSYINKQQISFDSGKTCLLLSLFFCAMLPFQISSFVATSKWDCSTASTEAIFLYTKQHSFGYVSYEIVKLVTELFAIPI